MVAMEPWLRETTDGVELELLVQPRAARSRLQGLHDGRLKVQLAAPPVDGEANEALLRLMATLLERPKGSVRLVRGETSRRKTVRVNGVDRETVRQRLTSESA